MEGEVVIICSKCGRRPGQLPDNKQLCAGRCEWVEDTVTTERERLKAKEWQEMQEKNEQAREYMDSLNADPALPSPDSGIMEPTPGVTQEQAEEAVATLLSFIGADLNSDSINGTPGRVVRMLREMTEGYKHDPFVVLARTFEEDADELILLKGIEFTSMCEHHLLPFTGTADVGYVPNRCDRKRKGRVVGLSKLARLVDMYARRLQLQERMTRQIAEALDQALSPEGVGVILRAKHSCMGCRGVRKPDAEMVTSSMLGIFRSSISARAEFLSLCGRV